MKDISEMRHTQESDSRSERDGEVHRQRVGDGSLKSADSACDQLIIATWPLPKKKSKLIHPVYHFSPGVHFHTFVLFINLGMIY